MDTDGNTIRTSDTSSRENIADLKEGKLNQRGEQSRIKIIARSVALVFASIAASVWLFFMAMQVVVGLQKGQDVFNLEGILLAALVAINIIGAIIAWWKTTIGIKILLVGGLALSIFSAFAAGRNRALAFAVSGSPFLVSSIILWFSTRPDPTPGTS